MSLRQTQWTEALRSAAGDPSAMLRVADSDTTFEATWRGFGRSIPPKEWLGSLPWW
ncbi:MAG: hypothetical protein AAGC96_03375 [Pseudomonadota bacterium]